MQDSDRPLASTGYFVWEPPSQDIAIWLSLDLVSRLESLVNEQADREFGGILLGRRTSVCDRRVLQIDGFEAVESEHARGLAYTLSRSDLKNLHHSLARHRRPGAQTPVGLFRSHLRKGIYLDKEDFSLFQANFPDSGDVFLVARPEPGAPPDAGFFFWEDGCVRREMPYSRFPLNREKLEQGGFAIQHTAPEIAGANRTQCPPTAVPGPVVAVAAANGRSNPMRRAVYGSLGAVLIATSLICALMMRSAGEPQTTPVSLSIERSGSALTLHWDPRSPAVQHATNAILWISDGGQRRRVDLTADLLKIGAITYKADTDDVNFRLELLKITKEGSESVRYVAERDNAAPARKPSPIAEPPTAQERMPQPSVAATPHPKPAPAAAARPAYREDDDREQPPVPATQHLVAQQPQPAAPPQVIAPVVHAQHTDQPSLRPSPVYQTEAHNRPPSEIAVSVAMHAEPPPKYQSWIAKVPLLRAVEKKHYKAGEDFTPPRAGREAMPRVPARLARELPGDSHVDFRLHIEKDGVVDGLELLSPNSDGRLVALAATAVREWHFQPAKLRDQPVSSDLVVNFRFHNPQSAGVLAQR